MQENKTTTKYINGPFPVCAALRLIHYYFRTFFLSNNKSFLILLPTLIQVFEQIPINNFQ